MHDNAGERRGVSPDSRGGAAKSGAALQHCIYLLFTDQGTRAERNVDAKDPIQARLTAKQKKKAAKKLQQTAEEKQTSAPVTANEKVNVTAEPETEAGNSRKAAAEKDMKKPAGKEKRNLAEKLQKVAEKKGKAPEKTGQDMVQNAMAVKIRDVLEKTTEKAAEQSRTKTGPNPLGKKTLGHKAILSLLDSVELGQ